MLTISELAKKLAGELILQQEIIITGINSLTEATNTEIAFLDNAKYLNQLLESQAAVFIVPKDVFIENKNLIRVENPRLTWAKVMKIFNNRPLIKGIHPTAIIGKNVILEEDVSIGAGVVIGNGVIIKKGTTIFPLTYIGDNAIIGEECLIHSRVTIEDGVKIGNRVILQSSCVIGSDGFGMVTDQAGNNHKVIHLGTVILEDEVEIGANTCIDRGTMGITKIGRGTKIDNLVHIAHNDILGKNCLIVAQVGISGSTTLGDRVTLAGKVGTVGHIKIGNNVVVAGKSGITTNLKSNNIYSGFPAIDHKEDLKNQAMIRRLPKLLKKIKDLTEKISDLEKIINKE